MWLKANSDSGVMIARNAVKELQIIQINQFFSRSLPDFKIHLLRFLSGEKKCLFWKQFLENVESKLIEMKYSLHL